MMSRRTEAGPQLLGAQSATSERAERLYREALMHQGRGGSGGPRSLDGMMLQLGGPDDDWPLDDLDLDDFQLRREPSQQRSADTSFSYGLGNVDNDVYQNAPHADAPPPMLRNRGQGQNRSQPQRDSFLEL